MATKYYFGLVQGRHQIPTDRYIFEEIKNVLDFEGMEETCYQKFRAEFNAGDEEIEIYVYVTGLTAATIAAINAISIMKKEDNRAYTLILFHFDRERGDYLPQLVKL